MCLSINMVAITKVTKRLVKAALHNVLIKISLNNINTDYTNNKTNEDYSSNLSEFYLNFNNIYSYNDLN